MIFPLPPLQQIISSFQKQIFFLISWQKFFSKICLELDHFLHLAKQLVWHLKHKSFKDKPFTPQHLQNTGIKIKKLLRAEP